MRFVLLNQFYPPDMAPTGLYLHDLARILVQRGHQVKVICSRRSYDGAKTYLPNEILDGVEVVRLPATGFGRRGFIGKLLDYTSFYGALLVALLLERRRPDLILALTTPPYIGLLAKLAAATHRCRHAHWIMDLYPDTMVAHGMKRNGFLIRILQKLARLQFKGAEHVFALGPIMAERVSAYLTHQNKIKLEPSNHQTSVVRWFPLWSNAELSPWPHDEPNPLRIARGWTNDVICLYSGNMGLGHRFDEFIEAAKRLGHSGPRWVFAGGGKRRSEIVSAAKSIMARIDFLDYVSREELRAHLCSADVHLASLNSSWQGFMVPSKLQGSFAVGRPVIYVGGRDCETARWIEESGGGWVVDENNLNGLLAIVAEALDPGERRKRGDAAMKFAREHFNLSKNCGGIAQLLEGRVVTSKSSDLTGKKIHETDQILTDKFNSIL